MFSMTNKYKNAKQYDTKNDTQHFFTWDAKVTPSPARSTVQITSEEKVLAKVQIFGVDGAMAIESEKDLKNIDISALLPGFYYAHVYAEDGTKTVVKFLKN